MDMVEDRRTSIQRMEWIINKESNSNCGFVESYKPNMDENRGAPTWRINYTDSLKYTWGSIPTTSKLSNTYRS